jgi:mRNA interferase MazF
MGVVSAVSVSRGDVFLVDLGESRGSEIRKARPCVVVSPDDINQMLPTCMVAPMTTGRHAYPFRVPCRFAGKSGYVVTEQLRSIDKRRLVKKLGRLSQPAVLRALHLLQEMFAP